MKTLKTFIGAIAVLLFGAFNTVNAEQRFSVYVEDIWEHKVIVVSQDRGIANANEIEEDMKQKVKETAEFACELYDRIAVPLSSWSVKSGQRNHLYACATEDPY